MNLAVAAVLGVVTDSLEMANAVRRGKIHFMLSEASDRAMWRDNADYDPEIVFEYLVRYAKADNGRQRLPVSLQNCKDGAI